MDTLIRMMFRAVKPMQFANEPMAPGAPPAEAPAEEAPAPATPPASEFSWKQSLSKDYANAALVKDTPDTAEGLNNFIKGALSLEQMLGHEKVPIPKGPDDAEGWARFNKAMGVPEAPDGYGLPDAEIPKDLEGIAFDKGKFAETVHKHKLSPQQAKGVWEDYQATIKDAYQGILSNQKTKMEGVINQMRKEWGDAYDTNVELGQMTINKFSTEEGMNDWLTKTLLSNPYGIKYAAMIGNQFAENKLGDFGFKRFAQSPDQAQSELDAIRGDMSHPYNNDKAPADEHDRAVEYVNKLIAIAGKR